MTSSVTDISIPDFNYSRPLDVHRWSDYSEVNDFIISAGRLVMVGEMK